MDESRKEMGDRGYIARYHRPTRKWNTCTCLSMLLVPPQQLCGAADGWNVVFFLFLCVFFFFFLFAL